MRWIAPLIGPTDMRLGVLASHPIQNHAPLFRELARRCDLKVYFAHRQTPEGQAAAGFGVPFDWDVDLLDGYDNAFLSNRASRPSSSRFLGCNTPDIADHVRGSGFDAFVVSGWNLLSYWQAVWACRRAGVPVLIRGDSQLSTQRKAVLRLAKNALYPWLLGWFDGFLYVGQRNKDYLRRYGVPTDHLFFVPHCVDNKAFSRGASVVRRDAASGGRSVLFVGKLVERKRPRDLIDALARLRSRGHELAASFVGSGPLLEELRERARLAGVSAIFHGFKNQSEMPALYAAADLLVLPSDGLETWGLVVNEAMASGTPAVVSDAVGCGPDLVEAGHTGAIFPLGDVQALAGAIEQVLALDRATVLSHLAKKVEIYSPERAADGILTAAQTLAKRPWPRSVKTGC